MACRYKTRAGIPPWTSTTSDRPLAPMRTKGLLIRIDLWPSGPRRRRSQCPVHTISQCPPTRIVPYICLCCSCLSRITARNQVYKRTVVVLESQCWCGIDVSLQRCGRIGGNRPGNHSLRAYAVASCADGNVPVIQGCPLVKTEMVMPFMTRWSDARSATTSRAGGLRKAPMKGPGCWVRC